MHGKLEERKMKPDYRNGALGALLDEYERVAEELRSVLLNLSEADFAGLLIRTRMMRIAAPRKRSWRM